MMDHQCVIILFSIHFVLKAEKILLAGGIALDVIPVPRQISSDCGMAIAFPCQDLPRVRELLDREDIFIARIYEKTDSGTFQEHEPHEQ